MWIRRSDCVVVRAMPDWDRRWKTSLGLAILRRPPISVAIARRYTIWARALLAAVALLLLAIELHSSETEAIIKVIASTNRSLTKTSIAVGFE